MKLYVSESPGKAQDFAKALGISRRGNGYLYDERVKITWVVGHLVSLVEPHIYDPELKKWTSESLPIIPEQFRLCVSEGKNKQFNIIKELMNEADEIICATDCDREGDLIFHYIYTLSGCKKPYKRILPSDLTINGIKKIIDKEIPPRRDIIQCAEARSKTDWLIGMNATRAVSIGAGRKITIGRVQTPTLALVCKRYLENKEFVPSPYFPVVIELKKDDTLFTARLKEMPVDEVKAKSIVDAISDISKCIESVQERVEEKQPLPYDIGSLQIDASKKFGYTIKKTLELAQALYDKHKLTTYPRTDSGYLTEELFREVPDRLKSLRNVYSDIEFESQFLWNNLPKRCIDDSKAPNHHGIIPTDDLSALSNLNEDERNVFDLIARRFLAAFGNVCVKDKTKYVFDNNGISYITTGSVVVAHGWRLMFIEPDSDQGEQTDTNVVLPAVSLDELVTTNGAHYEKKLTKPPALLTQDSLVKLMMTCGKMLEDKDLRKAMEENVLRTGGLGTSATRAEIIDNLFSTGLVMNEKRKIIPTEMGLGLYTKIKDMDIAKPELTASMQMKLDEVGEGTYDSKVYMNEIISFTRKVTHEMLAIGESIEVEQINISCPKCESGKVFEGKKGYGCSNWNKDPKCDFVIWKNKSGKKISIKLAEALISGKQTEKLKGFKKREGNGSFDAALKLNRDTWEVEFVFEEGINGSDVLCPSCKSIMRVNDYGAFCSDECGVKIWRKKSGKKISDSQLLRLIEKGETGIIKGFTKYESTEKFEAALVLKEDYSVGFKSR